MNKSLYVKTLTIICLMISLPLVSGGHKADEHGSSNKNETIASDWVTAGYTGKEVSINMVEQNMADDGVSVQGRYVGFGFNWDPRENEIDMLNWIQCIPFDETRGYISRVLAAITMYEGILRGGSLTLDSLDQEFLFSAD